MIGAMSDRQAQDRLLEEIRSISTKPGTNEAVIYDDGVEIAGSPEDSDASAGFVAGTFTPDELAAVTQLPVVDLRTSSAGTSDSASTPDS